MSNKNEVKYFCLRLLKGINPSVEGVKACSVLVFSLFAFALYGQQQIQYTQFMHNKMALNSSIAGSKGAPVVAALVRQVLAKAYLLKAEGYQP